MISLGIHAYLGSPGTGKTYRALLDAQELAKAHGCGIVVVDSAMSPTLNAIPEVLSIEKLLPVWTHNQALRFTPPDLSSFDRLMRICSDRAVGNCVVLVDEVYPWRRSKALVWLCRTWRASRCTVLMTTQHPTGDVMADLQAAEPSFYVFRLTHKLGLEWALEKGLSEEEVLNMPDREFLEII